MTSSNSAPLEATSSSEDPSVLSKRVASLTLENADLEMKNAALEQSANELLAENEHLQLDIHPASDLAHLYRDNMRLEEQLENAVRKNRELRAKSNCLYAWNAGLHKQLAEVKEKLRILENRRVSDHDIQCIISRPQSSSLDDRSQATPASPNYAAVSSDSATGRPSTGVVVFDPVIAMTPIVGIDGSRYIALYTKRGQFWQQIKSSAYVHWNGNDVVVPCTFVANKEFRRSWTSENDATLTYIGFTYPDKTSLCYIPVSKVVIQYHKNAGGASQVSRGNRTWKMVYGRTYVRLGIHRDVYKAVVSRALMAYRDKCGERYSVVDVEGEVEEENEIVWLNAGIKKTCTVQMLMKNKRYKKLSVARALKASRKDVCGDALLYMRFSVQDVVDSKPTLSFTFHTLKQQAPNCTNHETRHSRTNAYPTDS